MQNLSTELSFTLWRLYVAFRTMSFFMRMCVYMCLHRQENYRIKSVYLFCLDSTFKMSQLVANSFHFYHTICEKLGNLSFIKYDSVHERVKLLRLIFSSRRTRTLKPSAFSSSTMLFIQMRNLNKKVASLGQFSLFAQQELRTLFKLLNSISVA